MAEKRYVKGLFKDTGHIDQPDGTWRHARNMVLSQIDGSISNEGGTELDGYLGSTVTSTGAQNDKVIGAVEVTGDKTILFITNVVTAYTATTAPRSEIGMWDNGEYHLLFNPAIVAPSGDLDNDLNFKEKNPIEGTFKIDPKGDLIVYWTDDLNPPRAFNVDRQIRESGGGNITNINVNQLYGIPSWKLDNIDILNLFPYSGPVPHIWVGNNWVTSIQDVVKEGGGLRTGVYYLALAYVDDDLVATNFLSVSNPISIVDDYDHTTPTTKKDGARAGDQTSKSLKWRVSNLNVDYKYMRPVVIRKMGDATEAFKMNDVEIKMSGTPTPYQDVTFSGIEGFSTASVEEVIIDTIAYDTAKTIQQLDNVLYLGNTTRTTDLGYQKYANNIKSRSIVKQIDPFDEIWATADGLHSGFGNSIVNEGNTVDVSKSYRYIPNIYNHKGYMRDEVYAFYLVFIMNDGSMSYAYHIPGREEITATYTNYDITSGPHSEIDSIPLNTNASRALSDLSADAKIFHFYDKSWVNTGANSWSGGARHMQFWNNTTENYPNTNNFEIWDGFSGYTLSDLKGLPVRHHKMPSNANRDRTTIINDLDTVITPSTSDPTPPIPNIYTGTFKVKNVQPDFDINGSCCPDAKGDTYLCDDWSTNTEFSQIFDDVPANTISASASGTYSGNKFVAQGNDIQVTMSYEITMVNDDNWWQQHSGHTRIAKIAPTTTYHATDNFYYHAMRGSPLILPCDGSGGALAAGDHATGVNVLSGSHTCILQMGETLELEAMGAATSSSPCNGKTNVILRHGASQCYGWLSAYNCYPVVSYIKFVVTQGGSEDYHDADIKHKVNILGMQFDDIKIPESYKDKIQGFRIFRAKRKYSNRTILGQGPVIPMLPVMGILGMCEEALSGVAAAVMHGSQVIKSEGLEPEPFWACTAWKLGGANYNSISGPSDQYNANGYAYKNLQFYDFNLLRNKYSLSPATHLQVQYKTYDLAWNGPEINQPKKMITVLSGGSSTTAYTVKEVWGWDNDAGSDTGGDFQNCYEKYVNSAMFVGARYDRAYATFGSMGTWGLNRVLGQKSKAYLQGDSIFKAASLGFGGKVVNLGGNSSIILGLANMLELPAVWSRPFITDPAEAFGLYKPGHSFNLVTRDNTQILGDPSLPPTDVNNAPRHQNYIVNLNAFKTDVYKNIDNQELVWTGYEILGDDLDNFIFYPNGTTTGDYSTELIVPLGSEISGVFGGDTFISRYGVAEAYSPADDQTSSIPGSSIHSYIVENSDNINFRHAESDDSLYYPGSVAKDVLTVSGRASDLNHIDNIKYNDNYSAVNDVRPAFPLPLRDVLQSDFPTRTHRSAKHDTTSIIDNYRVFLANQFKDLPKNRGDLWKLSSFNNLLYFHMEESLFAAQGKQSMQMKDGSDAFIGSGDIFAQDPNEMVQAEGGFGGTQSQYAALTTRYGYFFVDQMSRKVFMMKDQLSEISNLGMEKWFNDNLPFVLGQYGVEDDNPLLRFGFHSIYDPQFKRIILTKREVKPTATFLESLETFYIHFDSGGGFLNIRYHPTKNIYQQATLFGGWQNLEWDNPAYFIQETSGWTISYYPELGVWGGFHDYVPYIYFNTSTDFYSLTDQYTRPVWAAGDPLNTWEGTTYGNAGIWKHNRKTVHGILYQENIRQEYTDEEWETRINYHPFEFESIHNEYKAEDVLLASINYTLETFNQNNISVLEHGFTKYFIYNTLQMSNIYDLEYLINTRRVGNNWKINKFRDMADIALNTNAYYMSTNTNIIGGINTGTITSSSTQNMFTYNGMFKDINLNFLDLGKNWDLQRKFIDKWVGIRLIYDNISNNSLNLYATDIGVRKMYR